mmetsp:Transcript_95338/g.242267  ORF Transcript_95338/g.242267 Transcript_95338/m.242267 type:complete len:517 (-) Transcript_95338:322-1872(-)
MHARMHACVSGHSENPSLLGSDLLAEVGAREHGFRLGDGLQLLRTGRLAHVEVLEEPIAVEVVAVQCLVEFRQLLLVGEQRTRGLALVRSRLLHEFGLVDDGALVDGDGHVDLLHERCVRSLSTLLRLEELSLVRSGILHDLIQQLKGSTATAALPVLGRLRRRRCDCSSRLVAGLLALAGDLCEGGRGLRVELCETVLSLRQDVDGRTLVTDGLLENQVFGLAILTSLLQGHLRVGNFLVQDLQLGGQGGDAVLEAQRLALEVFLGVALLCDAVLCLVDLLRAVILFLKLSLLLCLQLSRHLVDCLNDLRERIQADVHCERGEDPIAVFPRNRQDVLHGLVDGLVARGISECACLQKRHCLAKQITGVILGENRDGLGQGDKFLRADLGALGIILLVGFAILLEAEQELLIHAKCLLGRFQVLLGLSRLALKVCERRLFLLGCLRRGCDLANLRCPQALEGDHGLELLFLRHDQILDELVLHLAEHAQNAPAAGIVGAGTRRVALQAVRGLLTCA